MTTPAGRVSIPPFSTIDIPDERQMLRWAPERLQPLVLDWREEEEWPAVSVDGDLLLADVLARLGATDQQIVNTLEELQADDLELTTRDLADFPGLEPPNG